MGLGLESLKVATNTYHMQAPLAVDELNFKQGKYVNWQSKGVLIFAIVTILSLGIASCFFIVTAYLKCKRIAQIQQKDSPIIESIASNIGFITAKIESKCQKNKISEVKIFITSKPNQLAKENRLDLHKNIHCQVNDILKKEMGSIPKDENINLSCGVVIKRKEEKDGFDFEGFKISTENREKCSFKKGSLNRVHDYLEGLNIKYA